MADSQSDRASDVRGPVARMVGCSRSGAAAWASIQVMFGWFFKAMVTAAEKVSRSTARLFPAGTRVASAQRRISESIRLISAFRMPVAEAGSSLLKEFE